MKRQKKEKRKGESPEELADRLYTRNFSEERLKVRRFVRHPHFSAFIYGMIFVNTVLIACDDIGADRDNTHWVVAVSVYSDWIILTIFTGEMVPKMIGLGLGYKPPIEEDVDPELAGYFAGAWNRLDSFIVLMSWILVPVAAISGADIEKLVRVLRLTRPLRAIREIKNLRAINELIQTVCAPRRVPLRSPCFSCHAGRVLSVCTSAEGNPRCQTAGSAFWCSHSDCVTTMRQPQTRTRARSGTHS